MFGDRVKKSMKKEEEKHMYMFIFEQNECPFNSIKKVNGGVIQTYRHTDTHRHGYRNL